MKLHDLDVYLQGCIDQRKVPGAVALVGRGEEILFHKAYGHSAWVPEMDGMDLDTRFDLASLTKVCATLPCILRLMAAGDLALEDPLSKHMEVQGKLGKRTLAMLLTHSAGLVPFNELYKMEGTPQTRLSWLRGQAPENPPGKVVYSDVGFVLLGELLREKTGLGLEDLAQREVFGPLAMESTGFCPKEGSFAATEIKDGHVIRGRVHDENCAALGGVAGHAGLFSTAADLGRFARGYLDGSLLPREWILESFREHMEGRGLGWVYLTPELCWHTGFTGTAIWLHHGSGSYGVLLTNRVHPSRENPAASEMRAVLRQLVFEDL